MTHPMTRSMTWAKIRSRRFLTALAAAAVALPLAGCGVKSVPQYPEGATHPRQYPATGPVSKKATEPAKAEDQQTAPQGFPYEYPNRPPTR